MDDPRTSTDTGRFVALAVVFYGVLFGLAWLWRGVVKEASLFEMPVASPRSPVDAVWIGAGVGLALVASSRWWTRRSRVGERLARALREALPPLGIPAVVVLAAVSSLAEEALFRGALQPSVGWFLATLLFGAAHFVPRRGLAVWAPLAALAGGIFGALYAATGSLWAPIVAHFVVNALNLHWLCEEDPGFDTRGDES